jgi:ubiquitin carboxyl-terminal hydrolase 9/24
MTEKEIKEIDKESISMVLKNLKEFLTLALTEQETAKFIEINQLNMSFRFLKSTYLEKKLKGLQEIKSMISSIEFAQTLAERRNNVQGYGARLMIN